jgi:hypothetical protein
MYLNFGFLCLNEVRKNLASNLVCQISPDFVPFMQYTGKQPEALDRHHG